MHRWRLAAIICFAIGASACAVGAQAAPQGDEAAPPAPEDQPVERVRLWDGPIDTGGLSVGDPVSMSSDDRDKHLFVPVCSEDDACSTIVGFADPLDMHPELAPPDDPRISEIGYQPGAFALSDEDGYLTGYLVLGEGFMTPEEYRTQQGL